MLLLATLLSPHPRTAPRSSATTWCETGARCGAGWGWSSRRPAWTGSSRCEENLLFAARLAGLGGRLARAAVAEAHRAYADWRSGAEQPARQLSGGWRRLVDIARATLHQPDLLILDEPTVGLDPEHRERVWSILGVVRREQGTTVLFSTHYLAEAEPADRWCCSPVAGWSRDGTPAALRAAVGAEVAEIEGPARSAWRARCEGWAPPCRCCAPSAGSGSGSPARASRRSSWPARQPGIERLSFRPTTLEDVYFARTTAGGGA